MEHKALTETGEFIKAHDFEQIWIEKRVKNNYYATHVLSDDEYLDYMLWQDMNIEMMYKKHLPDTLLCRCKNPNIVFHGACLGCLSQRTNGLERCKGCLFFRHGRNKANLKIEGEEATTMSDKVSAQKMSEIKYPKLATGGNVWESRSIEKPLKREFDMHIESVLPEITFNNPRTLEEANILFLSGKEYTINFKMGINRLTYAE